MIAHLVQAPNACTRVLDVSSCVLGADGVGDLEIR